VVIKLLAWQPSGNFIASAGSNEMLHVWNPVNGNIGVIMPIATSQSLRTIAWSPDSTLIASGGDNQSATVDYVSYV
jgi:WD40 repeat protein